MRSITAEEYVRARENLVRMGLVEIYDIDPEGRPVWGLSERGREPGAMEEAWRRLRRLCEEQARRDFMTNLSDEDRAPLTQEDAERLVRLHADYLEREALVTCPEEPRP